MTPSFILHKITEIKTIGSYVNCELKTLIENLYLAILYPLQIDKYIVKV